MSRKHLHLLAQLGRGAVLAASLACAATILVLQGRPAWVDAAGAWLEDRAQAPHRERWERTAALRGVDPAVERAALADWSLDLAPTRKLDRLAPVARFVGHRLVLLCQRDGDAAAAIAHARRLVELDPRDLEAVAALGRLLGADPASRSEGIGVLREAWRRVPHSPLLVLPLCELTVAAGDPAGAARVLLRAATASPSNLWQVQWADDPRRAAWFLPRRRGRAGIEVRFAVDQPVVGLRFRLPAFRALELHDIELRVESEGGDETLSLQSMAPTLGSMRWEDGVLVAFGNPEPTLTIEGFAREHPCTLTLTAGARDILPDWLRDLLLGPAGARIAAGPLDAAIAGGIAEARARAFARCSAHLRWSEGRVAARLRGGEDRDGFAFTASWRLPAAATTVEIDLPRDVRCRYEDLALTCGGRAASVVAMRDLAREGPALRVTGADPRIEFALPESASGEVTLRGLAR